MQKGESSLGRRRFLQGLTAGAAFMSTPGLFAQQLDKKLIPTVATTEGPFYPDKMPLDTDNDLLIINDAITPGVGEITHLTGRVLTITGQPVRNAFVEIWQVDSTASYVHTGGRQPTGNDANFQGYGRFLTDSRGQYYFRTIKPISYTLIGIFRTAHVHFAISKNGKRVFTTQMLVKGLEANDRDGVVKGIKDPQALSTILVDFKPLAGSKIGELTANFDLVLGKTVEELEDGTLHGGIAISEVQAQRRKS
jgi:protocatechuate 3,4-dioxygenase beta subunit